MPFVKRLERRVVRTLTQHRPTWPRDKRPLETIDALTRANRAERNRGTERRLVELRFDAFRRLESPHKPPLWPRAVPDVFVGESIPEVSRPELSVERLHSAIRNHGSLLVRGLVDRDGVERLVADIDTALDAFDARAKGDRRAELDGWYEPFEHRLITSDVRARRRSGGNILAIESPPTMFDLIEIFNASGVGELVHDYFAERPAILARKVTLRRCLAPLRVSGTKTAHLWEQASAR